jgi:predicted phosphodiesterase
VSRILHISDVHLGEPDEHQWLDEHKERMATGDRRAQKHVLFETIDALAETDAVDAIEAVVVSGDLTNRSAAGGFEEFAEQLAPRLLKFTARENVLVVPGNHDVPQDHGPDQPELRYAAFVKATRQLGFATPLLDGIDFDAAGHLLEEARQHPHLVHGERFVMLPINSSHYCWGTEPLPDEIVEALLASPDPDELEKAAKKIRLHDVPRVSNAQIAAIGELLSELDPASRLSADDRVNVGVLHHQLLPVSSREEFKSFESLTNLGAVREFLVALGIGVVLHGHKHESALYWDYVPTPGSLATPPRRLLVTAAPGRFLPGELVARCLEVGSRRAAPSVRIEEVFAAERRGGPSRHETVTRARLWDSPMLAARADARVVRGASASDVYARVQSLYDGMPDDRPLRYLVCEIEDPSDARKIPADYARQGDPDAVQASLDDLVEWWQLPDPRLGDGVLFNHGERIYKRWGNQVRRAGRLLSEAVGDDPETTRAAILLLDPRTESSPGEGEFPSFVSIQLQLVKTATAWRLDCTGTFRKQEMRYWWPINVAELALVQAAVAERVTIGEAHPACGVLRTVTAHAIAEERLPVVSVPAVDRAVDQRPAELWQMAYSLVAPDQSDPAIIREIWRRYLEDLRPPEASDKAPATSRRGLQRVLDCVSAVKSDEAARAKAAIAALKALIEVYRLVGTPTPATTPQLRQSVTTRLDALDAALDGLFARPGAAVLAADDG